MHELVRQDNRAHEFVRRLHKFMCGACERKVCQEKLVRINLGGKDQQSCKGFKPGSRQEDKVVFRLKQVVFVRDLLLKFLQ